MFQNSLSHCFCELYLRLTILTLKKRKCTKRKSGVKANKSEKIRESIDYSGCGHGCVNRHEKMSCINVICI